MSVELTKDLDRQLNDLAKHLAQWPATGIAGITALQCGVIILDTLVSLNANHQQDPNAAIKKAVGSCLELVNGIKPLLDSGALNLGGNSFEEHDEVNLTRQLFENAWTTYDDKTYDHSVELIKSRFRANGLGEEWVSGKDCFDGGCGTGRLSLSLSQFGSARVVAADIGGDSLEYFRNVIEVKSAANIETVEMDVTDLSDFKDNSFDFVASYGVLHHTLNPDAGILEHFRILKPGGTLWLYLYGEGGLFWEVFDRLRPIFRRFDPAEIRYILSIFGVRQGLIYTFLDNFLAPRVYYSLDKVLDLLGSANVPFDWQWAKGTRSVDDPEIQRSTPFGKQLLGPDGEIRLVVTKASS